MDLNILKIDLDFSTLDEVKEILIERLGYLNDIGAFSVTHIEEIIAGYKTSYNVKIYLNKNISCELIIMLQLILGSDWRKETNTIMNHYKFNMEYSNRLFCIKRYKDGNYINAIKYNITSEILNTINNINRKICYN